MRAAVILLTFLLAGCTTWSDSSTSGASSSSTDPASSSSRPCLLEECPKPVPQAVGALPVDWDSGVPMRLFALSWMYGGHVYGGLQENGTTLKQAPSSCAVYRNATKYDVDECTVQQGPTAHRDAPWTLQAGWENTEEAFFSPGRGPGSIRIVAFNGTQPVAWWQGQYDRNDFSEGYF